MRVEERVRKLNIRHALIAGAVVIVMFIIFAVVCRIAPFGDNTYLMYDMKRQYVDFYAYYKSILRGENNMFYSFSTTLGAGMLGFFAYYLTSPFLLVLSLVPEVYLPIGITIIIGLKLAMAAVLMDMFFQYYIEIEKTEFDVISLGAVSWAFSGYLIAHSMNMMWMDVIILVPILVVAIDCILIDNRKFPYIITLALMLYLNYYITYQVLIFVVMWTVVRMFVLMEPYKIKKAGQVGLATILSAGLVSILMLPTALELIDGPKDITKMGLQAVGMRLSVVDIMSKMPTMAYDYIEARYGYPQIYCGVLLAIFCIIYFLDKRNMLRERVGMLILIATFFISFSVDELNLFWHAGMEPSGHPYREAFLLTFLVIICSVIELNKLSKNELKITMLACALQGIGFINVLRPRYDHVSQLMIMVNISLLVVYTILLLIKCISSQSGTKLNKVVMAFLMTVQMAELLMNAGYTYMWQSQLETTQSEYYATVDCVLEAVGEINSMDDDFFRMENLTPREQNDSMQYAFNGITHYSSAGMMYVRYFMQQMGYNDTGLYTDYGHNNTVAADSLLGIRYLISDGSVVAHDGYEILRNEAEKIYKNPFALQVAMATEGYDADLCNIELNNPFALQEKIYSDLSGEEVSIFDDATVAYHDGYDEDGIINRYYDITSNADGQMYMYLGDLLGTTQNLTIYLDDKVMSTYGNAACISVLELGSYHKGDNINLRINGGNGNADFGTEYFVTENLEKLARVTEKLKSNCADIEKKSSSHLIINARGDGLFLTIPWGQGWIVTVDGRKKQPQMIYGALMYIDLGENTEHAIEMKFVPKGILPGTFISIISLIITLLIAKREKK